MSYIYLTKTGAEKLKQQLEHLLKVIRPEATDQLAKAREHGDLSENAEFDAARDNMAKIDKEILDVQAKLAQVQIIDESELGDNSKIRILSQVKLLDVKREKEVVYTLVDPLQADPVKKLISVESPVGKGLLGKSVDDLVEVEVPVGTLSLKVLQIERAEGL